MAKLWKISSMFVKSEAVEGTAPAFTATDCIQAIDVQIKPSLEKLQRDYARNSLDSVDMLIGKTSYDVSFKVELKGNGTAGAASVDAPLKAIFESCGFYPSASATEVTFKPMSQPSSSAFYGPGKSLSCQFTRDGIQKTATGVVGNWKLNAEAGKIPLLEFTGKGLFAVAADASTGFVTGSNQTLPPTVKSVAFTMDSNTFTYGKIEVDGGNKISEIEDVNAVDGVKGFMITDRQPVGSWDVMATTVATYDFLTKAYAHTTFAATAVIGSVNGNKVTISLPYAQMTDVTDTAKNDYFTHQLPVQFNGSGSFDNWCTIKFQ